MNVTFPPTPPAAKTPAAKITRGRDSLPRALYAYGLQCLDRAPKSANPDAGHLLTPQNVADLLNVSRISVMNWTLTGKLSPKVADDRTGRTLYDLADILKAAREAIGARRRRVSKISASKK